MRWLYFSMLVFISFSFQRPLDQQPGDFVRLEDMDSTFRYDMRYATANNFLKEKVYDCDDCVIRKEVAEGLIMANNYFKERGARIKFFDCYRPLDIQKKMWKVFSNPQYVADPKKGSVHNRGGAVDITLVDFNEQELDMGTGFDHFGEEAHHAYSQLSSEVIANRQFLKEGMRISGFEHIESEWWHYNFKGSEHYEVSNFQTACQ